MSVENEVIDITDSFVLARHCGLDDDVIEIDDSLREDSLIVVTVSTRKSRKCKKSTTPKKKVSKKIEKRSSTSSKSCGKPSYGFGDCPICWDELGKNPMASTKCGHVYCLKCLEQSLRREKRCPTCRCSLKKVSAYHPLYLARH